MKNRDYFMPAEYEEHEAVWLGWQEFPPYRQAFLDVATALMDRVALKMIANDELSLENLKDALGERDLDTNKVEFFIMEDNRLWMRDHGATYLLNEAGEKAIVDFQWSAYAFYDFQLVKQKGNKKKAQEETDKELAKKTGIIDRKMAESANLPIIDTDVVMEGGSIEVNGKGTLILCEKVTFQRNPGKTKEELESAFKDALGVNHIIWLPEGLADDPHFFSQIEGDLYGYGTGGHTDEFVRFIDDNTVFLAWVEKEEKDENPINRINYERMSKNLEILEASTDQDGNPIKVIKVAIPDLSFQEVEVVEKMEGEYDLNIPLEMIGKSDKELQLGDKLKRVPASSYLNYLVTNGVVLLPTYLSETTSAEKEAKVKSQFQKAFPDRDIIFLNAMKLNYFGGGIHCITQQEPKSKK
ncbi:MAG: agmatine deiminase family protein [Bacteroidia bacterium]|nr:agmatine deiminase family protein [Bacteroidia bacterium]